MKQFDTATADALASRAGIVSRQALWITARNRATDLMENLGIWTGDDTVTLTIGGASRDYAGAGGVLEVEAITGGPGLDVRSLRWRLSSVAPEIEALSKGYDTRFAPVEIHRVLFDPATRNLVGAPHRVFRGLVNGLSFSRGEVDGSASADLEMVSETRALTRTLALKKSDESQKSRGGDRFRRYGDISGSVPVYWGEQRLGGMPGPAAPRPRYVERENGR